MTDRLQECSQQLNYHFKDENLLQLALTHSSYSPKKNNERLEFLGDSLVNFIIGKALFERFGRAREGVLTRYRASLVKGTTLYKIASDLKLGQFIFLGAGEKKSGGRKRSSILADALEAIIAAIYLDGGIEQCEACVLRWYGDRLSLDNISQHDKDAKTCLQEYLQSNKLPLPNYTVTDIQGKSHEQTFRVKCEVQSFDYVTEGTGSSRRRAEQVAAEAFLTHINRG